MKKILATGTVVGVLVIVSMFAMIHQQDNIKVEAAPKISEIAFLGCFRSGVSEFSTTSGITTVLDDEECPEALQLLIANDGLRINESLSTTGFSVSWFVLTK